LIVLVEFIGLLCCRGGF